jgi:hypothetical protein
MNGVGEANFGKVGFSQDNRLTQNEMRSPTIGELWISGLVCGDHRWENKKGLPPSSGRNPLPVGNNL